MKLNIKHFNKSQLFNNLNAFMPFTVRDYVRRLSSIPQGTKYHPEGNVLIHTKIVLRRTLKYDDINILLAAFFHDLGKVDTTKPNGKGGFSAHEHEVISASLVNYSNESIKMFGGNPTIVQWLVANHMRVKHIDEMTPKKRKSLVDHMWYPLLEKFAPCDKMGTLTILEVIQARGNPFTFLYNKHFKS